ncbi:phage tail length tape measure family protein [Devosia sp.]|uniref:phage tail length tape measure family protein n=1 Tax=Devosia sp. TaxID=1871048 RepID=UPI001AC1D168|nr:phage tail length tape measure family protein [Devosia sp.]MBN9335622.1 phage tail length tape measure family protein [Devosia sp.]
MQAQNSEKGRAESIARLAQLGRDAQAVNKAIASTEQQLAAAHDEAARSARSAATAQAELSSARSTAAVARQSAINSSLGIGVAPTGDRGADIAAYGNALDEMRAKFSPLFALEQQHKANLAEISQAYRLGAISADEQSAAIERANVAHRSAVVALDGHAHALDQVSRAMARSNAQRTNLLFQLQDVAVTLAMGMNPLMVAMQQGSQISMIYGPGEGGLGRAFQETAKMATSAATKFWPLAVAAAAIGVAVGGMRHEIEETTGVAVSFGDVFMASLQVVGGYLYEAFRPQIEAISEWFGRAWDLAVQWTKNSLNFMIGSVMVFLEQIRLVHDIVPQAFQLAGELAANAFLDSIQWMVNSTMGSIDRMGQEVVKLWGGTWTRINWKLDLEPFKRDTDATAGRIGTIFKTYQDQVRSIIDSDYMGTFYSDVQQQALKNYNARLDDTDKSAKRAASGMKIADDAAKAFKETMDFGRDTFRSFITDMRQGLSQGQGFWEALGNAGANALDKIADRALGMMADGIFNMIIGAFMPGFGQTGGSWGNGLWGSAIFNAKGNVYQSPALSAFSNKIVDQPTMFAFAKGAGIMGEAGAEAIIPLTRTSSGDLGVRMTGDVGVGMSMGNITFAPVSNFYGGFNSSDADLRRMLDERDRHLLSMMPGAMAEARYRAVKGAA